MITISLRSLDHNPVSLGLASMPWPCLSLIYYHKDYNITKIAGLRASLSGPHPHVMASPIFVIYYCRKDYNIAGIAGLWAGLSKPQPYTMDSLLIVKRITISLRSLDYDSVSLGLTPMPWTLFSSSYLIVERITISQGSLDYELVSLGLTPMPWTLFSLLY